MKVELTAHAFDLVCDRRCAVVLPEGLEAVDFLGHDRERRLQSVGEIACSCDCPPNECLAVLQQVVHVANERLDLHQPARVQPVLLALSDLRHARPHAVEPAQPSSDNQHASDRTAGAEKRKSEMVDRAEAGEHISCERRRDANQHEQAHGPQQCPCDDTGAERTENDV